MKMKFITEDNPEDFTNSVNKLMSDDWVLYGDYQFLVSIVNDKTVERWIQCFLKMEEEQHTNNVETFPRPV